MSDIIYPTRARIVDAEGLTLRNGPLRATALGIEWTAATPPVSRPHIGKEGLAEKIPPEPDDEIQIDSVRITLDDGTVLWGWECWWEPVA